MNDSDLFFFLGALSLVLLMVARYWLIHPEYVILVGLGLMCWGYLLQFTKGGC